MECIEINRQSESSRAAFPGCHNRLLPTVRPYRRWFRYLCRHQRVDPTNQGRIDSSASEASVGFLHMRFTKWLQLVCKTGHRTLKLPGYGAQ